MTESAASLAQAEPLVDSAATFAGDCTCATLRQAARRLTQIYDSWLAPEALKTSQYSLLAVLSRWSDPDHGSASAPGPAPTVQALAGALALDRTTLGHNLRPLQRSGLLLIEPDAQDRRIHRVTLTDAGRTKVEACRPLWQAAQTQVDATFGAERSAALRRELSALASRLAQPHPST